MNSNSDNPKVGKAFQELVQRNIEDYFGQPFELEKAIPIGKPAKLHRFDLVSQDLSIVVECKCYTWTDTGNVPSAKLMGMNEALFYMGYLPESTKKILCVRKSQHPKKTETLAEYYVRIDGHLLRDVCVFEVDDDGQIAVVRQAP